MSHLLTFRTSLVQYCYVILIRFNCRILPVEENFMKKFGVTFLNMCSLNIGGIRCRKKMNKFNFFFSNVFVINNSIVTNKCGLTWKQMRNIQLTKCLHIEKGQANIRLIFLQVSCPLKMNQ